MDGETLVSRLRLLVIVLLMISAAACTGQRGMRLEDIPTQASLDALASAVPLTQNAPPAPYNTVVTRFDRVDNGLTELAGWRYVVQLEFEGVFARTPRQTTASARAEVWFNQLASARRVNLSTSGELIGQSEDVSYEAVRLGPDSFLVRDGVCLDNAGADAETAANLGAGDLIGGVLRASPGGQRAVLNGEEAWLYTFAPEDLSIPAIRLGDDGRITVSGGELWIAPARKAVVRFYVNLDVENAVIFDRQLPVTGRVLLRYDVYEIGEAYNITIPFGC